ERFPNWLEARGAGGFYCLPAASRGATPPAKARLLAIPPHPFDSSPSKDTATMARDISIVVNGMKFPNPFVIGSGPPSTNGRMMQKAFADGWGGVVCKTMSLDASKVVNVAPRYGRLRSRLHNEVIGFENIELISDM